MLIGKRISGRYKIIEMIGGGGMSNVYLAHDMILDRDVAIKVLRYDFSNEEDLHRRFQREALSATSLTHPNIVNIFDVGEDGDIHYLVMEYVEGKTLKQYIVDSAPLPPLEAVEIMKQLTSAIANAHHNQIIHRDIKPQNILMDDQLHVKITDFGIAMALSATSFTQTNSVLGTVHYLSPEQARGGTATKKSDIYALGIVLFELLTGKLPFSGESAVSIALKHLQTETPSVRDLRPEIPQSLENVVMKATAKDPMHRYRSVEEMQRDLETVLIPERSDEQAFFIPFDDDATKAMPVIKNTQYSNIEQTKINAQPVKEEPVLPISKKTKKSKWPWIIGIIGFLLMLGLLLVLVFPSLFGPARIEIPDVSNMPTDEAIKELSEAGFIAGEEVEETSEEIPEGSVIRTTPQAGKIRDEGSTVDLFISRGKELTVFTDYTGRNIDQVMDLLSAQNYKSVETTEEFSDEPKGTILSQTPEDGAELLPEETDVVFTVSKGKDLRTVIDLMDYNEKTLNDYAKSSGFNIQIVREDFSETVPVGNVISQDPSAGTEVAPGSKIYVVLSKGPIEKPIKSYFRKVEIPYEPNEDGTEQIVRVYIQDQDQSMAEPAEEFVLTEDRTVNIQLDIQEGQKAAFRIDKDGTVIAEESIEYDDLN
ncbi:Stk1 family PASTA domain-containing Ser/Thr kinase [Paenisporosarcina quisquiliarum]|uniref:Stk1 family PASTA domain-containing Ser/Thr kinase n=1 Tax=Paenisporosarcina quisquiliarum TaxID=365346 RepID=UPI0037356F3C